MYNKNVCSEDEYIKGKDTEIELKPIIENLLKCKLSAKGRYSKYDFEDTIKNILVEVKGRKISSNKYNTTYRKNIKHTI